MAAAEMVVRHWRVGIARVDLDTDQPGIVPALPPGVSAPTGQGPVEQVVHHGGHQLPTISPRTVPRWNDQAAAWSSVRHSASS